MRKYLAEFIGTMVLVLIGCGTAMAVGCDPSTGSGYILTAFAFGLALLTMAYSIGNISGCHINPAVSLGMWISGRIKGGEFCGYVLSQILGAFAGAGLLALILSAFLCFSKISISFFLLIYCFPKVSVCSET